MTYNIRVSYPVLWPDDGPFYGPIDSRGWPRTEIATAVEEYSYSIELISRSDNIPVLEMHWTMVIGADGGFSLRAEWNVRQENHDA